MKLPHILIAAGLAAVAGTPSAWGADWGGVREVGGSVATPVPAPAPIPTYDADSDWYVGLAFGANISQGGKIGDTDVDDLGGSTPGHLARNSGDIGSSEIYGINFGRYITPSLRIEFALDYTPDSQITKKGFIGYSGTNSAVNPNAPFGVDTNTYAIDRLDDVKVSRTTGMVNALYDIHTGTRFAPYIGGGFGFTWRTMSRNYGENYTCTSGDNSVSGPLPGCSANVTPPGTSPVIGSSSKSQFDFAAAVQAGVATNLTDQIIWDNGWQMLWESNSITSVAPTSAGKNVITYKDGVLQQFRSGIRVKFD